MYTAKCATWKYTIGVLLYRTIHHWCIFSSPPGARSRRRFLLSSLDTHFPCSNYYKSNKFTLLLSNSCTVKDTDTWHSMSPHRHGFHLLPPKGTQAQRHCQGNHQACQPLSDLFHLKTSLSFNKIRPINPYIIFVLSLPTKKQHLWEIFKEINICLLKKRKLYRHRSDPCVTINDKRLEAVTIPPNTIN